MVGELLRKRVLERDRLLNRYYTIAVDAVHEYTFDEKHCDHCLVKEDKKGKKVWQHIKLVANLVTANGLCLPVVTEWIENEGGKYKKQDCELKAFYRLVPKIRQRFPRLEICLLLDSLYCGEPTFELLKAHRMEGIIVFKEGSMPEVFEWAKKWMGWHGKENVLETSSTKEIQLRCPRTHEDRLRRNKPEHKNRQVQTQQTYRWMERLPHWDETREFNILTCKEVVDGQVQCNYIWLVTGGIRLNRKTVEEVANQGGRKRWVIENEGFNTQKNGGYQLEHAYSKDAVSMKCWNELLDIAHIFRQLIEKGSLIQRHLLGPTINLGKRLFEHLRYYVFEKPEKLPRIQIRFAWPDTS